MGVTSFSNIPDGAIYGKVFPIVDSHFSWRVKLCRKEARLYGQGGTEVSIFSDYTYTFWGAKRKAAKLYRKYRRRQKRMAQKETFIVFEVPK